MKTITVGFAGANQRAGIESLVTQLGGKVSGIKVKDEIPVLKAQLPESAREPFVTGLGKIYGVPVLGSW